MAKKKKGGNKKKKGASAGRGNNKPQTSDGTPKNQSLELEETKQRAKGEEGGAGPDENSGVISNAIGDIKVEPSVSERVKGWEEIRDEKKAADDNVESIIDKHIPNDDAAAIIQPPPADNDVDTVISPEEEGTVIDAAAVVEEPGADVMEESNDPKDGALEKDDADEVLPLGEGTDSVDPTAIEDIVGAVEESSVSNGAHFDSDADTVPLSKGEKDGDDPIEIKDRSDSKDDSAHVNEVDTAPSSNEEKCGNEPTAIEDEPDAVEASEPPSLKSNSGNVPPMDDAKKEPTGSCSVDGADVNDKLPEVESVEDGTMQVDNDDAVLAPGIVNDTLIDANPDPEVLPPGDDSPHIKQRSFSTQLTQEMEEVDLDSADNATSSPIVRAYNGTPNGLSPATHNTMSFAYNDSNESEAFTFLTAALRESLGLVANEVEDEVLCRYIRWKPDVKRAKKRFLAYNAFRTENSYIFNDKPLLLSQDPKLTFLIQNGFVMAPEELCAMDGSGVLIVRGEKCDITAHNCSDEDASRSIFYILQRMVERNTDKGITIILDLAGAGRKNLPRGLGNLLSKAVGCFPLRVRAIYVVSMPWWFPAGSKRLFSIKMRSRIRFLKDKVALHEYIEKDRMLEEDGGINIFDLKSWIAANFLQEVEATKYPLK